MKFSEYGLTARNEAIRNLNRKLAGKKIVWDNPQSVLAYKQLRREGGQTLRWRLSEAAERTQEQRALQSAARKAGFRTVEEFVGVKRVLGIGERVSVIRSMTPTEAARFKQIKWKRVDGRLKPVGILPKRMIPKAPPRRVPKPVKRRILEIVPKKLKPVVEKVIKKVIKGRIELITIKLVAQKKISELKKTKIFKDAEKRVKWLKKTKAVGVSTKIVDIVTGGIITEKRLNKKQGNIQKEIESFNRRFGGRELSEGEFAEAKEIETTINDKVLALEKEQENLIDSFKGKIARVSGRLPITLTKKMKEYEPTPKEKAQIERWDKEIKQIQEALAKLDPKDRRGIPVARKFRLETKLSNLEEKKEKMRYGIPIIAKGIVPITPLAKITAIQGIATQRTVKGKTVTDIVFKIGKKRVGIARGVTVSKRGKEVSFVVGKTGLKTTVPKLLKMKPGQALKLKGKFFRGVERGVIQKGTLKIKAPPIKPLKFSKKQLLRRSKIIRRKGTLRTELAKLNKQYRPLAHLKSKKAMVRKIGIARRRTLVRQQLTGLKKELEKIGKVVKKVRKVIRKPREEILFRRTNLRIELAKLNKQYRPLAHLKAKKAMLRKLAINRRRAIIRQQLGRITKKLKLPKKEVEKIRRVARKVRKVIRKPREEILFQRTNLRIELAKLKKQYEPLAHLKAKKAMVRKIGIARRRTLIRQQLEKITKLIKPTKRELTFSKNIRAFTQVTKGKVSIGKKAKYIDDVMSKAHIFNSKDLDLIVGKTISGKGNLIKFKILVKRGAGLKRISLSSSQKLQFRQALEQVVGVASSKAKAGKIPGLSKVAISSVAAITRQRLKLAKVKIKPTITPRARPRVVTRVRPRARPRVVTKVKPKVRTKQQVVLIARQRKRLKSLTKQQSKLRQRARTIVTQAQRMKLAQRARLLNQQISKSTSVLKKFGIIPRPKPTIRIPPMIVIPRIKIKPKVKPIVKKVKRGYDVYARPLKKKGVKKIPKLIKINKVPLSKQKAEDLRNYIVDTSLSRTGKVKPIAKKPQKPKLKVPYTYGSKTKYKFRKYKIRKKKKVPLIKGKVIEKRKRLLDTPQEKAQITLARRVAQLEKKARLRPIKRKTVRKVRRTVIRTRVRKPQTKKFGREVIKKAPKGKKPTRFRFKGRTRLGFRNNKVVEIIKFSPRTTKRATKRRTIRQHAPVKRTTKSRSKPSPAQLDALAKGREIRSRNLKKKKR